MSRDISSNIAQAEVLKAQGNEHFKRNELPKALQSYWFAWLQIKGLDQNLGMVPSHMTAISSVEKEQLRQLQISIHGNFAAVHIKQAKWPKVIEDCELVLKADADNAKALFRRGKAYLNLGDLDRAQEDLNRASALAPTDSAVKTELALLARKMRAAEQKQKAIYAGMFARMRDESDADATTTTTTTTASTTTTDTTTSSSSTETST